MSLWYAAHILMYVRRKDVPKGKCPVWENIILIKADSEEEAFAKATARGREEEGDDDGTFRWGGKPAEWVFAGVRKLTLCEDPDKQPGDGTEVSYLEMEVASEQAIRKLLDAKAVGVTLRIAFQKRRRMATRLSRPDDGLHRVLSAPLQLSGLARRPGRLILVRLAQVRPRRRRSMKTVCLRLEALEPRLAMSLLFVATRGDDTTGDGSRVHPWRTIQHAADRTTQPGTIVFVEPGEYAGFDVRTGGTAAAPITYRALGFVNITTVEAQRSRDGINVENFDNISWVVIDGFTVTGKGLDHSGVWEWGIRVVGDNSPGGHSDHVTVRNCTMINCGEGGFLSGYADHLLIENNVSYGAVHQHGIYVSNSPLAPVIRHNVCFNNFACGIQINADGGICDGGLIEDNVCYNNGVGGGAALNFDGLVRSVVQNNLLYGNHASGIVLYVYDAAEPSHDNVVVNNTVVQAADAQLDLLVQVGATGNKVFNNIFTGLGKGVVTLSADSQPGFEMDDNLVGSRFEVNGVTQTLAQWQARGYDADSVTAWTLGGLFVDAAGDDYHLHAGRNPAVHAGTATFAAAAAPANDLDGRPRPTNRGWDLGAYARLPR